MCILHSDGSFDVCNRYKHGIQILLAHAKLCKNVKSSDYILVEAVTNLMEKMETMCPSFRMRVYHLLNEKNRTFESDRV